MKLEGVFIHEQAICESSQVGTGTRIWPFSHVLPRARIGRGCNICEGVFVENGVVIGDYCTVKNGVALFTKVILEDYVFIGPNAVFTNDLKPRAFLKRGESFWKETLVKRGATIGANATIVCGVVIFPFAMVGAGAVVTRDIPPFSLAVGNPARVVARICFCGERLEKKDFCPSCRVTLRENPLRERFSEFKEEELGL